MAHWPPLPSHVAALSERFHKYVARGGADECWSWTGARTGHGYGHLLIRDGSVRREYLAHRLALFFAGVDVPSDRYALHSCDNKRCCNPAHLRVGTHAENMKDRAERQRHGWARGESNGSARLTAEQVVEIRRLVESGATHEAVGLQFGVAPTTIGAIARRNIWAHIGCAF